MAEPVPESVPEAEPEPMLEAESVRSDAGASGSVSGGVGLAGRGSSAAIVAVVAFRSRRVPRSRGADDPPEATSPDTTLAEESVSVGVVPSPDRVAAVYQVGYRGPDSDDSWGEWAADGRNPPEDIASDFYPVLGRTARRTLRLCRHTSR